jgi:hypothetical protein
LASGKDIEETTRAVAVAYIEAAITGLAQRRAAPLMIVIDICTLRMPVAQCVLSFEGIVDYVRGSGSRMHRQIPR